MAGVATFAAASLFSAKPSFAADTTQQSKITPQMRQALIQKSLQNNEAARKLGLSQNGTGVQKIDPTKWKPPTPMQ